MRLEPIVQRLKEQCPALGRRVLHALQQATPKNYPAAYVLPLADQAAPNALIGAHTQKITTRVAVEIMVKQASEAATGGPAQASLEDVREEVLAALLGWQPEGVAAPIDLAAGRLLEYQPGLVTWRDEFTVIHYRDTR